MTLAPERRLASIPGVVDVIRVAAPGFPAGPAAALLELPHGATRLHDYHALASRMRSTLPPDLQAFFCVNTDIGTPEVALQLAAMLVEPARFGWLAPGRSVLIIRSHLPRTLIDCNRVAEPGQGSGLTGRVPDYVTDDADRALLESLHAAYCEVALAAWDEVLAAKAPGDRPGRGLSLHSYAPRSVPIERVTASIVAELRHHWANPEALPLRPEVDLIHTDPAGVVHADAAWVAATTAAFAAVGIEVAQSVSYKLHPATFAGAMALRAPQQALTIELRRDLLADPFDPFVEMHVPESRAKAMAAPIAAGWLA